MKSSRKYAIIDVETTGGSARRERLTEIAIAIHDGRNVLDTFESLINPERPIPPFIQNLTGITNEMVEDAPYFYEIARKIVEMTEGCIFVAHNVKFDYMFIRSEFERLGYSYQRRQLCTKQLSKKLFPQIGRYGLDRLIDYFNIQVETRHRAMADVQATVEVFNQLLHQDQEDNAFNHLINNGIKLSKLPGSLNLEDLHRIPETSGIYYFFGHNDHLLYVGKSKNIQKRVMQHFSKPTTKSLKFLVRTQRIDYEETGSEIAAILREDEVIKKQRPEYNIAQRKTLKPYGLHVAQKEQGSGFKMELHPIMDEQENGFIKTFKSKRSAKLQVQGLLEKHGLSEYFTFDRSGQSIVVQSIASNDPENKEWDTPLRELLSDLHFREDFHYIVIDDSYSHHEAMCFVFHRGILIKTGTLDIETGNTGINPEDLNDCRPPLAINDQVITFIQKHKKRYKINKLPSDFQSF